MFEFGFDGNRHLRMQSMHKSSKEGAEVEIRFPENFTRMLVRMKELQPENCLASNIWIKQAIGRIDELHTVSREED